MVVESRQTAVGGSCDSSDECCASLRSVLYMFFVPRSETLPACDARGSISLFFYLFISRIAYARIIGIVARDYEAIE